MSLQWTDGCVLNMHADVVDTSLCQLVRKLLVMSANSAAIDHIFSSFGLIQSKLRNQLWIQKCVKLVSFYGKLRGKYELGWL